MATKEQWAQGLQGAGAWFSGQGPQYEAAKALQSRTAAEDERQRKLDELAMNKERVAAMTQDFAQTLSLINSGRSDLALQLLDNRLPLIEQMGGDTYHTRTLRDKIAEGSPDVVPELTSFLTAAGVEVPTAGAQYSNVFTTQSGQQAGLNGLTGQIEIIPSAGAITARAPEGAQLPASLQEMAWLNNPARTAEELDMYWRNKRAEQIVAGGGGAQISVSPSGQQAVIVAPEDAAAREAAQATAVKGAEATAAAQAEATARTKRATQIYAPFSTQLVSLREAFQGTGTGPLVGRIAALSGDAQKAEAAANIMEPIIKGVVRDAGEGTFTEGDRAQIRDMMPKRTDHPEVVVYKTQLLDNFVRGKLGVPSAAPAAATGGFKIKSIK